MVSPHTATPLRSLFHLPNHKKRVCSQIATIDTKNHKKRGKWAENGAPRGPKGHQKITQNQFLTLEGSLWVPGAAKVTKMAPQGPKMMPQGPRNRGFEVKNWSEKGHSDAILSATKVSATNGTKSVDITIPQYVNTEVFSEIGSYAGSAMLWYAATFEPSIAGEGANELQSSPRFI